MKRLNKFSSLILSVIFAFGVAPCAALTAGCNNREEPPVTEEPPSSEVPVLPPEEPSVEEVEEIKIGISGKTEVFSGGKVTLGATVSGTDNETVSWAVTEGSEFASIDQNGVLTAQIVEDDKIVKVTATSAADGTVKADKTIIITSQRELTQDMLDVLNGKDVIAFDGYLDIDLYTVGAYERFTETHNMTVKTAMDGTNWYAEYENSATGLIMPLYYRNHNDIACQVGVSLMNSEEYSPMLDSDDAQVSWTDSGLYNNFKGLKVEDFEFNKDIWRYEYKGSDDKFLSRTIASANPYDFVPTNLSLIIEDGEIIGFRSVSEPDYTIAQGYKAIQTLTVAVNYGETVKVPTVEKYEHVAAHDKLTEAIANMQSLKSYTLDYNEMVYSVMTSGFTTDGFVETITGDICYFDPYRITVDEYGKEQHIPTGDVYGYKKIEENLYNTFSKEEGKFVANRAYAANFANAKPSFAFAAEIFTQYYEDEEDGTTTYYVDEQMCPVASTFYYGVGNDISLYGIFASLYRGADTSFTPYVVVKDGHITEAAFYFYLGYLYGIVELKYGDFDTAKLPEGTAVEFEVRQVPTSWSELTIQVSSDTEGSGTEDDKETNALDYLKEFFGDDNIAERMPFFGVPLGDTYGFGMTTVRITGSNTAKKSVMFYYDVPLDTDYSINSSLEKVNEYLLSLGFEKNSYGEYKKGDIVVAPVDSDLDLMIYVWKA